jgi:hypothetical protein
LPVREVAVRERPIVFECLLCYLDNTIQSQFLEPPWVGLGRRHTNPKMYLLVFDRQKR